MIAAALKGKLDGVAYKPHAHFGVNIPQVVPGVPSNILDPRELWEDKALYDAAANKLAKLFAGNFSHYEAMASVETRAGAPVVLDDLTR